MMEYEQRMSVIRDWVGELVTRYERPSHLQHEKAAAELRDMAEDLNSEIPAGQNREQLNGILERTARQIRKRHRTRSWPTINLVVSAAKDSLPANLSTAAVKPETLRADRSQQIAARRIKAGEAVSETWLVGRDSETLLAEGLVTLDDLAPYREAIQRRQVAGQDELEELQW